MYTVQQRRLYLVGGPLPRFKQICCVFCLSQNVPMNETVIVNRYLKLGCITLSGMLKNIKSYAFRTTLFCLNWRLVIRIWRIVIRTQEVSFMTDLWLGAKCSLTVTQRCLWGSVAIVFLDANFKELLIFSPQFRNFIK